MFTVDQAQDSWYRKLVDRVKSVGDIFPDSFIANVAVYHERKQVVSKEGRDSADSKTVSTPRSTHARSRFAEVGGVFGRKDLSEVLSSKADFRQREAIRVDGLHILASEAHHRSHEVNVHSLL